MITYRLGSAARRLLSFGALGTTLLGATTFAHASATTSGAPALAPAGAARSAYFAGKRAGDGSERRRQFSSGIALARQRLAARPDDPEGLLWLAANLGAEALERGKLSALNVLGEMERLLLRLDAVAPDYDHAAAARTLARLYHKAPAFISIGSSKKARLYWQRALDRAGDYPPNWILAADFYADDGQKQRARALAQRYLAAPVSANENPEAPEWMAIARDIAGPPGEAK
jgi:tetratricopeptide (TPR) repeat protein